MSTKGDVDGRIVAWTARPDPKGEELLTVLKQAFEQGALGAITDLPRLVEVGGALKWAKGQGYWVSSTDLMSTEAGDPVASNRIMLLALKTKPPHADENWLSDSAGRCVTAVPVGPYLCRHMDEANEAWERQGVFVREPRATPHSKKLVPKIDGFLRQI